MKCVSNIYAGLLPSTSSITGNIYANADQIEFEYKIGNILSYYKIITVMENLL